MTTTHSLIVQSPNLHAEVYLLDASEGRFRVNMMGIKEPLQLEVHPLFGCIFPKELELDHAVSIELARAIISKYAHTILVNDREVNIRITLNESFETVYEFANLFNEDATYSPQARRMEFFGSSPGSPISSQDDNKNHVRLIVESIDKMRSIGVYTWKL